MMTVKIQRRLTAAYHATLFTYTIKSNVHWLLLDYSTAK